MIVPCAARRRPPWCACPCPGVNPGETALRKSLTGFGFLMLAALAALPAPALAAGAYPKVACTLNADKSSILVLASNGADQSYQCMANCNGKAAGQRAFTKVACTFNLGRNAAEKTVCTEKGKGPNFFTEVGPTKMVCVPR